MAKNTFWMTQCEFKVQDTSSEADRYCATAAVFASSRYACYQAVKQALAQRNYEMLWVEDAHVLQEVELAVFNEKVNARIKSLNEINCVTFTAFELIKNNPLPATKQQYLLVDKLDNIYPLNKNKSEKATYQEHQKIAPEPLQSLLFNPLQIDTSDSQSTHPLRAQVIKTYAILDAAKLYFFNDESDAQGLPCECLFDQRSDSHLLQNAPYIVELDQQHRFTQQLFIQTDQAVQWHFWEQAPCIFVRSAANLSELRQHFKKFVRIKSAKNKNFFFRFYDPSAMTNYWERISHLPDRVQLWFQPTNCLPIHSIISYCVNKNTSGVAVAQGIVAKPDSQFLPFTAHPKLADKDQIDFEICTQLIYESQTQSILNELKQTFPDKTSSTTIAQDQLFNALLSVYQQMYGYGFNIYRQLQTILTWALFYGVDFIEQDPDEQLIKICNDQQLSNKDKFAAFKAQMYQLEWYAA